MATTSFPQGNNTYLPSVESSKGLFINFSRNPDAFALNKYIQIVPVEKSVGRYVEMTVEQAGRITSTNDNEHLWEDGEDAPSGRGNTEKFAFKPYLTERRVFQYRLGKKSTDQAQFDVLGVHGKITAQQAMTSRTVRGLSVLTTAGNWPTANTSAVSSISGVTGKWDVSTTARLDIKKSVVHAVNTISLQTLSGVQPYKDLVWVMSPKLAGYIVETQEIADFIKGSPAALDYIKNNLGPNSAHGLPGSLYGLPVCIEETVKTTNNKGATRAAAFAMDSTVSFIAARPGGLNGSNGDENEGMGNNESPSFATCTMFVYEDMTVSSKLDEDNRVHKGRIVTDDGFVLTAGMAGYLFTACAE